MFNFFNLTTNKFFIILESEFQNQHEDVFLLSRPQDIQQNLFSKALREMETSTASKRKDSNNLNPFHNQNTINFEFHFPQDEKKNEESLNKTQATDKEEELEDLSDSEVQNFIVNEEEYKLKKILWEVIFKEWIEEQKNKEKIQKMISKKRLRKISKAESTRATNPIEAIRNSTKFKKNINMGIIENLFSPKAIL